jgi:hypothetical protein
VPHLDSDDPVEATLRNAKGGNTLVRCQPADSEVAVDGVVRGVASDFDGKERLLALPTGDHRVGFRHKGYEAVVVDVVVGDGRQTLDVRLTPLQLGANERRN